MSFRPMRCRKATGTVIWTSRERQEFRLREIPDATPEIILSYALSDEQALLAKVRYNRLLDIFLGITTYSLQNHLRTTVAGIGQIEIDEIYVGIDRHGRQYIMPMQGKPPRNCFLYSIKSSSVSSCGFGVRTLVV